MATTSKANINSAGPSTAASVGGDVDSDPNDIQGVMNVTKEDQQMINRFAKLNARHEDLKEEIAYKTNELKNYEDAVQEAEVKMLEDEGDKLHLQVGDILVNLSPEQTQAWLEEKIDNIKKSLESLESRKETITEQMTELKAHLYAKFGNNIHLESGT